MPLAAMRWVAALAAALALAAHAAPSKNEGKSLPGPQQKAASEQELRELRARIEKLQAGLAAAEKSSGEASEELRTSAKAVSALLSGVEQTRTGIPSDDPSRHTKSPTSSATR